MRKNTFLVYLFLIFFTTLFCTACTPPEPTVFGIPQSQWNTLTAEQRADVIRGYNEQQAIKERNVPIQAAIGAASNIAEQEQYHKYHRHHDYFQPVNPPMPPFPSPSIPDHHMPTP